jgi:hypothetical protein
MAKDKLITVRIEDELREEFKKWCEVRGLDVSVFLYDVIRRCLDGKLDESIVTGYQLDSEQLDNKLDKLSSDIDGKLSKLSNEIDNRIDKAIAPLQAELEQLKK